MRPVLGWVTVFVQINYLYAIHRHISVVVEVNGYGTDRDVVSERKELCIILHNLSFNLNIVVILFIRSSSKR